MNFSPWYFLFLGLAAFAWAKLEIEIEGKDGWAANLPTWRIENHDFLKIFYGDRPLTGYHVWAFTFVFLFFHVPFFWAGEWSWKAELNVIGAYNTFWIVEDFLWFLINPHYGWRKFSKEKIWWHKRWFLGLPVDYWIMGPLGIALLMLR